MDQSFTCICITRRPLSAALALVLLLAAEVAADAGSHDRAPPANKEASGGSAANRNPYAGDASAVAQGQRLFMANNCYGCHSPGGGGAMGPALIDAKWKHGGKPRDLYKSVAEGHPDHGMPPFGRRLSSEEIWKVVAFVQSMAGER